LKLIPNYFPEAYTIATSTATVLILGLVAACPSTHRQDVQDRCGSGDEKERRDDRMGYLRVKEDNMLKKGFCLKLLVALPTRFPVRLCGRRKVTRQVVAFGQGQEACFQSSGQEDRHAQPGLLLFNRR